MSYLALARKWRPRRFAELVGQEHVVRVLTHALSSGRIHHALLFSGTRGVGKTTLARIYAKALQCEQGVRAEPCGHCGSCREIDEGCHPDLIEIDAASNTGVDHVRDLIEGAQYAPVRGRAKVYLIDEVHMLSRSAFNALLKTLEEPPAHVRFLFATTDPERLPATVLSRCLKLALLSIEPERIAARLAYIAREEGIPFEPEAMAALARAAEGSLRDGLSLLDQAIAFGGGRVMHADVEAMLGWVGRDHLPELLAALLSGEAERVDAVLAALSALDIDHQSLLAALAEGLHRLQVARLVPAAAERLDAAWRPLVERCTDETLQLWYQIALLGRRDLPLAPSQRIGFDMTVWRMFAFRTVASAAVAEPSGADRGACANQPAGFGAQHPVGSGANAPPPELDAENWPVFVRALDLKASAASLAEITRFQALEGDLLRLEIEADHGALLTPKSKAGLEKAIAQALGRSLRVEIAIGRSGTGPTLHELRRREEKDRQQGALGAAEEDATLRALRARFAATILPDSIEPN